MSSTLRRVMVIAAIAAGIAAALAGAVLVPSPAAASDDPAVCADGVDNDGDGKVDFPADPGCGSASSGSEKDDEPGEVRRACSDGLDNDGDGLTDFPADPGCGSANSGEETDADDDGSITSHHTSRNSGPGSSLRLARAGCATASLTALVRVRSRASLRVAVDGRRVRVLRARTASVRVRTRALRPGVHRLTVRARYADGSREDLRLRFMRCSS